MEQYIEFVLSICSVSFGNTADRRLGKVRSGRFEAAAILCPGIIKAAKPAAAKADQATAYKLQRISTSV